MVQFIFAKPTILICFFVQLRTVLTFNQCDYDMEFERVEIVSYNKEYATAFKVTTFKHNRTATAFNISITLLKELTADLQVVLQAYKFASNEYRLFPLRFQCNFCDSFTNDEFGFRDMYKCGTFSGCPFEKRHYEVCNWIPNQTKFPPLIPNGRYMVEAQLLYFGTEISVTRAYAGVVRPFGKTKFC